MEDQYSGEEGVKEIVARHARRIECECSDKAELYTVTSLRWAKGGFWQKNGIAILTGLSLFTTGSVFSQIFAQNWGIYVAAVISFLVTLLTPFRDLWKPDDRANLHETARNKYESLQKQALLFRTLYMLDKHKTNEDLIKQLAELQKQRDDLNASCVPLPDWIYKEPNQKKYRKMYQLEKNINQFGLENINLKVR